MIRLYINNYLVQSLEDLREVLFENVDPIKIEYRFDTSDVIEIADKLPLIARTNDYWIECRASYIVDNCFNTGKRSLALSSIDNRIKVARLIKEDNLVKLKDL